MWERLIAALKEIGQAGELNPELWEISVSVAHPAPDKITVIASITMQIQSQQQQREVSNE